MYRSHRQNINRETLELNYKLNQISLNDNYRTFHPTAAEYTFFSSIHRTFLLTDHMLNYKTSLNKFKKAELYQAPFLTTMV